MELNSRLRESHYRNPPSGKHGLWFSLGVAILILLPSCAARDHAIAELEGNRIQDEKVAEVDRFRREQLIDPASAVTHPDAKVVDIEVPDILDLDSAIRIATRHSRSFQSQRESFFSAHCRSG